MKKKCLRPARSLAAAVFASALALSFSVQAGLQIPYTPDANTLHLWHLDDPNGLTATDAVVTSSITLTNIGLPNPGTGPYTNTSLGSPSFTGLGTCMSGNQKSHLLFGGSFPDVSQFCNPVSGAFTFEAVLKFDVNPLGTIDAEIVAGDNGGGITTRGWQWRIFNGVMEWDLLAGSTDNDFKAALPATGADAAIPGAWYHVAVSYTGASPTNGDTPNLITFYWTALDANRVAASKLGQFTATRPLDGSPEGTSAPNLGIGGSGRVTSGTNPGNSEGIIGSIDEVRISSVALSSNQMAFVTGGALNPPSITRQPPASTLVGYGKTLTVPALVSGTLPLTYQWQQDGTNLANQTDTTLVIPQATFANGGNYRLIVTNNYGAQTSTVAQVTVGAAAAGLFNTGLDTNGVVSSGDIVDPNWTLFESADPAFLGPNLLIFEYSFPIQFADPNGSFSPTNGKSMWIGPGGNAGGVTANSPAGNYLYRAKFLLDSAEPSTFTVQGNLWVNGSVTDILVNGKSTGITLAPGGTLYVIPFAVTNGFVSGWNTLDFVVNMGTGISGLRVELQGVGLALPAGLPTILDQPANQTVRDASVSSGSEAMFSVAALGRPPLSYQWWADGAPLAGATKRTLTFVNPTSGGQGKNFSVVVSNDSGSVTSQVAVLTIVSTNQPPVPGVFSFVAFPGQTVSLSMSDLVQGAIDPDHDPITFVSADTASTNGTAAGLNNVVQNGAVLVYTPVDAFIGADQFSYTLTDSLNALAQGFINILELSTPTNQTVAPGGNAGFSVGVAAAPAGYSFQWQLNGTNIAGATAGTLAINGAQLADSGSYRLVATDPQGRTWTSPVAGLTVVSSFGTGTGLTGDYYAFANGTTNFTGAPALTRVDPTVDFNWGTGAPDPSLPTDFFQVRWHGQVQPLFSDVYTFYTTTDDGARLWVNGQFLVNRWQNQAATTASGTIALNANQKYSIVMEYYENTSAASAQLSWSSLHQVQQVVPMTQLYPDTGLARSLLTPVLSNRTNLVLNWSGTFNLQSAPAVTGPWSTVGGSLVGPYSAPITTSGQTFFRLVDPAAP